MATTGISAALLRKCFGAVYPKQTPNKILNGVLQLMETAHKDAEKAGSVDDMHYYEGMVDACDAIARMIAPLKPEQETLFWDLQGKLHKP